MMTKGPDLSTRYEIRGTYLVDSPFALILTLCFINYELLTLIERVNSYPTTAALLFYPVR
jgi:hypothetical protein